MRAVRNCSLFNDVFSGATSLTTGTVLLITGTPYIFITVLLITVIRNILITVLLITDKLDIFITVLLNWYT